MQVFHFMLPVFYFMLLRIISIHFILRHSILFHFTIICHNLFNSILYYVTLYFTNELFQ
jgi:hypothetical protein